LIGEEIAKACAMFSAIDFVSANEMFAITATTIPRSGNVMSDELILAADGPHPRVLHEILSRLTSPPTLRDTHA
jgi:hypothetical protein